MLDIECGAVWNGNWEGVWLGHLWIKLFHHLSWHWGSLGLERPTLLPPAYPGSCLLGCLLGGLLQQHDAAWAGGARWQLACPGLPPHRLASRAA